MDALLYTKVICIFSLVAHWLYGMVDNDGFLTEEELQQLCKQLNCSADGRSVHKSIDLDQNNQVCFDEFVRATFDGTVGELKYLQTSSTHIPYA